MLILEPTLQARALARKQVEVVNYPDGRFAVRHEGTDLPYRVLDKIAAGGVALDQSAPLQRVGGHRQGRAANFQSLGKLASSTAMNSISRFAAEAISDIPSVAPMSSVKNSGASD